MILPVILVGQLQFMMKNIVHKWSHHVTIKSVSGAAAVLTERRPYTTYDSRLNTYSEVNDRARLLCRAGFYQTAQGLVRCCLCDVSFSINLPQLSGELSSVERFHARWDPKNSISRPDFLVLRFELQFTFSQPSLVFRKCQYGQEVVEERRFLIT